MSLILRKECQVILDNNNLRNYHVDINDNTKCLDIVSECGKILISIHGIKFVRLQPYGLAEIEYATELLEAFMVAHRSAIANYLAKLQLAKARPTIQTETDKYKIKYIGGYNDASFYLEYSDKLFTYYIDDVDDKTPRMSLKDFRPDLRALGRWTYSAIDFNEALNYLMDFTKQVNTEKDLTNQLALLSVCDI